MLPTPILTIIILKDDDQTNVDAVWKLLAEGGLMAQLAANTSWMTSYSAIKS